MAAMEMSPGPMSSMGGSTAGSFLFPLILGISLVTVILTLAINLSPTEDQIKAEALMKRRWEAGFRADSRRAVAFPLTATAAPQPAAPPQAKVPVNPAASARGAAAPAGSPRLSPRRRPPA
jgi:hypothetical protein